LRGQLNFFLFNHGKNAIQISKIDGIAQLILEKYEAADPVYRTEISRNTEATVVAIPDIIKERDTRGIGPTGLK
jgi:dUTPase